MLLDTGKLGNLREIELTSIQSILLFMVEYPIWKNEEQNPNQYVYGDQTDFA